MDIQTNTLAEKPAVELNCTYQATGPTTLRCAKCNRPLMTKDARRTPTGYVCPYYIKARVATFYNATPFHYALAGAVAVVLGLVAGFLLRLAGNIGFFAIILMIFAGPIIGGVIAEAIRRALGRTRGQYIWLVSVAGVVVGAAYFTVLPVLLLLSLGSPNALFSLIPILGLVLTVSTMVARMRY